jgi:uncharacterized protein (DUF58 family)
MSEAGGAADRIAAGHGLGSTPTGTGSRPTPTGHGLRPTPTGRALAGASISLLVLAYAFGYPALAALGSAGVVVLLCVVPLAARRPPVELEREVYPLRVTRGEAAVGLLTVRNESSVRGQRLSAREHLGGREIPVRIGQLPPHGAVEIRYPLPTSRRGLIEVGPLQWDRTDPLGLIGRRTALPGTAVLRVHPVVHRFPLDAAAQHSHGEQARTDLAPEGSITFHTLREYVPGDDLRRIHWRASAHRGELMVRQNIDVTPPRATIVLITDAELYADPEDFEHAVDVAASATLDAIRSGQPITLWTTSGLRQSGNGGAEEAAGFLDQLAAVELTATTAHGSGSAAGGLSGTIDRLEHADRGGALVVVGGVPQPRELAALSRVAGRFGVGVLARLGQRTSAEQTAGSSAGLTILDAATATELCDKWIRLAPALARSGAR